jgi:hypothetical protein
MAVQVASTYETREAGSGRLLFTCTGPTSSGACGRVTIGENVACAGEILTCMDTQGDACRVPNQLSLCPITLLQSLAVPTDSSLLPPA